MRITQHEITRQTVDRINELLKKKRWSVNHLAHEAGIPQSTIKSILHGESKNPTVFTIGRICDAFDITLSEFFREGR